MSLQKRVLDGIAGAAAEKLPLPMRLLDLPTAADGQMFRLDHGLPEAGFTIDGVLGWKSLSMKFSPKDYSAFIVRHVDQYLATHRSSLSSLLKRNLELSGNVRIELDGVVARLDADRPSHIDARTLEIRTDYGPFDLRDTNNEVDISALVLRVAAFIELVRAVLPLESIDDVIPEDDGLLGIPEGARIAILVNRYERSRKNREECIRRHGAKCAACGFDFENIYGETGRGFIQVHHVVPVSRLGQATIIDVSRDLVPLCSNCHSMAHRRNPPYTVEDLQGMLQTPLSR